jgi:hypothetical protein
MTFHNKYRMRSQQLTVKDWSKQRSKEEHGTVNGPEWNTGTGPAKLQHSQSVFSLVLKSTPVSDTQGPGVRYCGDRKDKLSEIRHELTQVCAANTPSVLGSPFCSLQTHPAAQT